MQNGPTECTDQSEASMQIRTPKSMNKLKAIHSNVKLNTDNTEKSKIESSFTEMNDRNGHYEWGADSQIMDIINKREHSPETASLIERRKEFYSMDRI